MNEQESYYMHQEAMDLAEQAHISRFKGLQEEAKMLFAQAFQLEYLAAESMCNSSEEKMSRSILYSSAAHLAHDANLLDQAESCIYKALAGELPPDIWNTMKKLLGNIAYPRQPERIMDTPGSISLLLKKGTVPPGVISIKDINDFSNAFQDSVSRLIQQDMGINVRQKLTSKAQELGELLVTGIREGSAILDVVPARSFEKPNERNLVEYAIQDLSRAFDYFFLNKSWPRWLPDIIRKRLSEPMQNLAKNKISFSLEVKRYKKTPKTILFTEELVKALQIDDINTDISVEITGEIVEINIQSASFKVKSDTKTYTVKATKEFIKNEVDQYRWMSVVLIGKMPSGSKTIHNPENIRLMEEKDKEGIRHLDEEKAAADNPVLNYVRETLQSFQIYDKDGWDSYNAKAVNKKKLKQAEEFFQLINKVLYLYEVEVPKPFLVPTLSGGIQFEWDTAFGQLELEVLDIEKFAFLFIQGEIEEEGECEMWKAIQLVREIAEGPHND